MGFCKIDQLQSLVSSFASRALDLLLEQFPKKLESQACGTGFALTKAKPVLTAQPCFQCFLLQLQENCQSLFPSDLAYRQGQGHTHLPGAPPAASPAHVSSSKFQQNTPRGMKPSWQTYWLCCNLLVLAAIRKLSLTVDYQLACNPLAQPQTVSLATYKTSSSDSVSSACNLSVLLQAGSCVLHVCFS